MLASRSSLIRSTLGLSLLAAFAVVAGCEIIAGIDDKTFTGAAAGGSGGMVTAGPVTSGGGAAGMGGEGGTGSGGGAGGGSELPSPLCDLGAELDPACDMNVCDPGNTTDNPCHCGFCDHSCGEGQTCNGFVCSPVVMSDDKPLVHRLATDGVDVFFPSYAEMLPLAATIYRMPLSATKATPPTAMHTTPFNGRVKAIAVDCDNVYFAGAANLLPEGVFYIEKDTDGVQILSETEGDVRNIVVDNNHVIWVDSAGGGLGKVRLAYKALGLPTTRITLAQGQSAPVGLATDGFRVYWSNTGMLPGQKAIKSATIPEGGGMPVFNTLVDGQGPLALAVDKDWVYWIGQNQQGNGLFKVGKGGGPPQLVTGTGTNSADVLAIQGDHIYWTQGDLIFRARKDGMGTPTAVFRASDVTTASFSVPSWLTIDRARIYTVSTDTTASTIVWVGR